MKRMVRTTPISIARSPATLRAARWSAWAARIEARFRRHHASLAASLLFWIGGARALTTLVERWLRPTNHITSHRAWFYAGARIVRMTRADAMAVPRAESSAPIARGRVFVAARRDETLPLAVAPRLESTVPAIAGRWRECHTRVERQLVPRHRLHVAYVATERLLHRSDRIERIARFERTLTLRREPAAAVHSAAMAATVSAPASSPSVHSGRAAPIVASASAQMPSFNVDLLAEQVIRHIDRRVVARRERMGRV